MSINEEMDLQEEQGLDFEERQLWQHSRRPEWGAAVLVDVNPNHAIYQFQDGMMRTFRQEFTHMFEPMEAEEEIRDTLMERLAEKHVASLAARRQRRIPLKPPVMSLDEQVMVFRSLYPSGFADPAYLSAWRFEAKRSLKRHIDPDIARAQASLSKSVLGGRIAASEHKAIFTDFVQLMRKTALVSPSKEARPLSQLPAESHGALGEALFQLLHGEGRYRERLRGYVLSLEALQLPVTWSMVTTPGALLAPQKWLSPKRTAFQLQARGLKIRGALPENPTPRGYQMAIKIANRVKAVLTEADLPPRDLFDVRNFIWETLRPRGVEHLKTIRGR